jgi:hypothetical protein
MSCLLGERGVILLISWIGLCWYYFFSIHYDRSFGERERMWEHDDGVRLVMGIQVVNRVNLTLHK